MLGPKTAMQVYLGPSKLRQKRNDISFLFAL